MGTGCKDGKWAGKRQVLKLSKKLLTLSKNGTHRHKGYYFLKISLHTKYRIARP